MASAREHRDQARANRAFAEQVLLHFPNDQAAMQWAVTAAFYCAVHCAEAHLDGFGLHSRTHQQRETFLANPPTTVPVHVYASYRSLKQRSLGARYLLQPFTSVQVRGILDSYLAPVAAFVGL